MDKEVEQFIVSLHPPCTTSQIVTVLDDLGVKRLEDLQYVEQDDLQETGTASKIVNIM